MTKILGLMEENGMPSFNVIIVTVLKTEIECFEIVGVFTPFRLTENAFDIHGMIENDVWIISILNWPHF